MSAESMPRRENDGGPRPPLQLRLEILKRLFVPKDFGVDLDAFAPTAILRQGMNRPTKKRSPYERCVASASFAQRVLRGSCGMLSQLCPPLTRHRTDSPATHPA